MLLIQKGKPTKRYCDRCHSKSGKVEVCADCQRATESAREQALRIWRERRRQA